VADDAIDRHQVTALAVQAGTAGDIADPGKAYLAGLHIDAGDGHRRAAGGQCQGSGSVIMMAA
jgi:hypothetical protein